MPESDCSETIEWIRSIVRSCQEEGQKFLAAAVSVFREVRHKVPSNSDPSISYEVWKEKGKWRCTCPHHTYRDAICKHILSVKVANVHSA